MRNNDIRPTVPHGRLGLILLMATETILFSTFIGAYVVFRNAAAVWPPAGTPRLHPDLSLYNTLLLVLSTGFAFAARWQASRGPIIVRRLLTATFLTGLLFIALQIVEFRRLYARGLTLQTGSYGAIFYSLITCHGLHVLGGLIFLAIVIASLRQDTPARLRERVGYCEIYWHFVTVVWLILFCILYIA
jgi:heme/copper-type cytochrome/quinol oxidase subunit 3